MRIWPRIRPWAAASLAMILVTILICLVEVAYPNALVDLFLYGLIHVWPTGVAFRGSHVRIGGPVLAFVITSIAMSIKEDAGTEGIRDFAARFILSKSFSGIFFVPPIILYSAIQVQVGYHPWSSLFSGREFHIPVFLESLRFIRYFPVQSVAFGIVAYGINRDRAALFAAGIGGMAFLLLSLATTLGRIPGSILPPFYFGNPVP